MEDEIVIVLRPANRYIGEALFRRGREPFLFIKTRRSKHLGSMMKGVSEHWDLRYIDSPFVNSSLALQLTHRGVEYSGPDPNLRLSDITEDEKGLDMIYTFILDQNQLHAPIRETPEPPTLSDWCSGPWSPEFEEFNRDVEYATRFSDPAYWDIWDPTYWNPLFV